MTRKTNARIAGFTYLLYIAVAFPAMMLSDRATSAPGITAKLARIGEHASDMRIAIMLSLVSCFAALVLAVTLYRITRDEDPDLAMLAFTCRVGEGVLSGAFVPVMLGLLWLGTAGSGGPDAGAANALGALLLKADGWSTLISAIFFAVGSTLFSSLLLRGRMIPMPLAWLGVVASVPLVVALPMELTGLLHGPVTQLMWIPMAAFEIPLGLWLIVKGVAPIRSTSVAGVGAA